MERGGSSGSSGGSSFMAGFGENNNNSSSSGISSMVMMSSSSNNNSQILDNNNNNVNNKLFVPLSWSATSTAQRVSAFVPQPPHNNSNHNLQNSCRAKIMAHPLFPRLLAAYVNCQKVR